MFLVLLVGVQHLQAQKVWDGSVADGFESGSGTKESPYEIQTPEQFAYFIQAINKGETFYEKEIVLTRDISLNGKEMGASTETTFSGSFNGLGHCIYDTYCKAYSGYYGSHMFYNLEGLICNLSVQGKYYSSKGGSLGNVSFVAKVKPFGTIYNCKFKINMNIEVDDVLYIIAGENHGSIADCYASGTITYSKGYYWETRYNDGEYEDGYFGGLVGGGTNGVIYCTNNVNGQNYTIGSATDLEVWMTNHPEISKVSCDYTESTCTIEITDPEGVVVYPNISVRNGISFGGISLPTTGFDCTVTGYTW